MPLITTKTPDETGVDAELTTLGRQAISEALEVLGTTYLEVAAELERRGIRALSSPGLMSVCATCPIAVYLQGEMSLPIRAGVCEGWLQTRTYEVPESSPRGVRFPRAVMDFVARYDASRSYWGSDPFINLRPLTS